MPLHLPEFNRNQKFNILKVMRDTESGWEAISGFSSENPKHLQ